MYRVVYFFFYSILMGKIIPNFFQTRLEFFQNLGIVTTIQSLLILYSWGSPGYRILIEKILVNTGNISFLSEKRPPGFMNSAGAGASVILGVGATVLFYLVFYSNLNKNKKLINFFMYVLNMIAVFIVGRTGLFMAIALQFSILMQVLLNKNYAKKFVYTLPLVFIAIGYSFFTLFNKFPDQVKLKLEWITKEFNSGFMSGQTATALRDMTIKPLSFETLIGTSKIRLPDGNHDSGYIQNYHSMGLIISLLFYLLVLFYLSYLYRLNLDKEFKQRNFFFILTLICSLFIIEIKEPFIFYYFYPMFIVSYLSFNEKEDVYGKNIKYNYSNL
ncbi:hypothetical protein [Vagococcus fluvialis]|uniref:hypothetical protein n=1 Tax=Vagococcus fluvialis TaxID=2738 RepID=UPI003D0D268D